VSVLDGFTRQLDALRAELAAVKARLAALEAQPVAAPTKSETSASVTTSPVRSQGTPPASTAKPTVK
jgi:hypothetical protein